MPVIPSLRRQEQEDVCKLEARSVQVVPEQPGCIARLRFTRNGGSSLTVSEGRWLGAFYKGTRVASRFHALFDQS